MQAEFSNNRKNDLTSSPSAVPTTAAKSHTKKATTKILKGLISVVAVICCCIVFFRFFTFATGVYCNGNIIAAANNMEDFSLALTEAKAITEACSSDGFKASFLTSPIITLRSKTSSAQELRDKMLLSSGSFIKGCALYIGNHKIFDAESEATAKIAVDEYIKSYAMNGDAALSENPQYKPCIIPKGSASLKGECISLLKENNISVVSVVNETTRKVVPFETYTENDSSLFIGETVTVTEGKNGNIQIQEETVYKNGEEQSVRIASEKVTVQPVNKVVKVGTKHKNVLECGLHYPLEGVLSSPFGERWGRMHEGIDIAVAEGTPIKAAECGTVTRVSENAGGYGKLIQIDHGYGVETLYAHLSQIQVTKGQTVNSDTVIGLSGNTGRSTGPHLHFEITSDGTPIDPLNHLK